MAGVIGSIFGVASVFGPALGGWMTDGPGWRWVFYVNLPVGLIAVAVLFMGLPSSAHEPGPIDWFGATTIVGATVPLCSPSLGAVLSTPGAPRTSSGCCCSPS